MISNDYTRTRGLHTRSITRFELRARLAERAAAQPTFSEDVGVPRTIGGVEYAAFKDA